MTDRHRAVPFLALLALSSALACGGDDGGEEVGGDRVAEVRDALDAEVRTTLATMLYENEGSRDHLLAQAEADDPELWAEIDADGEVTLDEFRSIPAVQDAVNHYGGDVISFFESEMVDAASDE